MTHGSLFAGIGGFDLGFERAGIKTVWQVEIDEYCRRVLERHFPDAERFSDVRECGKHNLRHVDVLTGGFPCQDLSLAGLGAGLDGERSGLWSEYFRLICELRPRFALVENVSALLVRGFGRVIGDLAEIGYRCEWDCLCAGYFGAPHLRERVFLLAYPNEGNGEARLGIEQDGPRTIFAGRNCESFPIWLQAADSFAGMDDGLSHRLYESRGGSLGNAVVPQIAEWIARRILEAESRMTEGKA
jgi:DNA (cytosine-5)-methyltransferase 1